MHLDIRVSEESEFFDMKLLKEFCSRARSYNNDIGDDFQVRSLGGNEQSAEIILNLIKQGKKTGTFSLPWIANAKNYDETISGKNVILCDNKTSAKGFISKSISANSKSNSYEIWRHKC